MQPAYKLRIARPSDQLDRVAAMYEQGLGLQRLGAFADHDGFDGVMLGHRDHPWHLEFTQHRGHAAGRAPTRDNLLVFYVPDPQEHQRSCERMRAAGFVQVPADNPYWERQGVTFEDCDGYRVVVQMAEWTA